MPPSQIGSYTILSLSIPATSTKPTTHTIYLRPHTPKIPTPSSSRSLFLVNVPIDSTSAHFRAVFAHLLGGAGKFEGCTFERENKVERTSIIPSATTMANANGKKRKRIQSEEEVDVTLPATWDRELRRSGSTAVVEFVDEKSVELALKSIKKLHKKSTPKWPIWGEGVSAEHTRTGSQRYSLHKTLVYPSPLALQRSVDAYMTQFNALETSRAESAKRARNEPDEDGFVTVSRGGRVGPARQEEVERKRQEMEDKEKKKREEMGDFYRFQMRERRKEGEREMVRRFEEDRWRLERIRKGRGRVPEK